MRTHMRRYALFIMYFTVFQREREREREREYYGTIVIPCALLIVIPDPACRLPRPAASREDVAHV